MSRRCREKGCFAPTGLCKELDVEYPKCEHWIASQEENKNVKNKSMGNSQTLPWTGEAIVPEGVSLISSRSNPIIIGMIGTANAGKTSYLGMLFRLMMNGKKMNNWHFSGSFTLAAWEMLAQYLLIRKGGEVVFAPPTPSNKDFYSLYHLALRQNYNFQDVLFADSSGEVFLQWANDIDDPNAENARWICENSSAFIFFVDSEALVERKGAAVSEITQMAQQLKSSIKGRPVVVAWSKADKKKDIKPNLKEALIYDLNLAFDNPEIIEVSNFSTTNNDQFCHVNNIALVEKVLDLLKTTSLREFEIGQITTSDLFFNYRGNHANK